MERMQPDAQQPGGWKGLGEFVELTPDRQIRTRKTSTDAYDYALKSQTHLWAVVMSHRVSENLLDYLDKGTAADPADMPILDNETLLDPPAPGCLVCEQPYSQRLRRRRCPGEPA